MFFMFHFDKSLPAGDWLRNGTGHLRSLGDSYSFEGITLSAIILSGDFDNDGDADGLDLAAFASAFGSTSGDLNYNPGADFDNNGCVDESDLAVFATDFSRTGSGPVLYFADAAETPTFGMISLKYQ